MSYTLDENMSPLALYVEQVLSPEPLLPSPNPKVAVYPPSPPQNTIFDSLHSAPMLDKARTNRILIYPGSFNPPHRGHLHLLKHAFLHGAHDLNIVAAIIVPRRDESVSKKVKAEDGKFLFGREERCLLWKQDICFPPWAWVYEYSKTSCTVFSERLIQAAKKDGFSVEFVPLYGPEIASPSSPPVPAYGCETIIMSDAARGAEFFRFSVSRNSDGRAKVRSFVRDFDGCTKWRRIRIDEDELRRHAEAKANRALLAMRTICPQEARSMLEDGMYTERSIYFPLVIQY